MTPADRVGRNIRRARDETGMSQEECAFLAGLARTQISFYETGRQLPKTLTLVSVAGTLSVTPNDLLEGLSWSPGAYRVGQMLIGEEGA